MSKLFIIKIGGNVLDDQNSLSKFIADFAAIKEPRLLVHGGGKIATKIGDKLGIKSKYVDGRRITDKETLELVTMVYGGMVNKGIVAALQSNGCNAIGVTGADGNLIKATKRAVKDIDYGFVGDVEASGVNTTLLYFLLKQNVVPVFAPLTHGDGMILNTNADTIASVLAIALSKHFDVRLIYCFDRHGVLKDVSDDNSLIHSLNKPEYNVLRTGGSLADGILPKLENAFHSIDHGVKEVLIGHAEDIGQNLGEETKGTLITR